MYVRTKKHTYVLICVTVRSYFTQYLILGTLKTLYPNEFQTAMDANKNHKPTLCKLNGTEEMYRLLKDEKFLTWKLCSLHEKERHAFMAKRKKYLIPDYEVAAKK